MLFSNILPNFAAPFASMFGYLQTCTFVKQIYSSKFNRLPFQLQFHSLLCSAGCLKYTYICFFFFLANQTERLQHA